MTIGKAITKTGIKPTAHDSARRALMKIINRSFDRIPEKDLIDMLKVISAALSKSMV